jgi:hypothetical protein
MKKFLSHSALLTLVVASSFFWTKNPVTSSFSLQLVALIIALFILFSFLSRKSSHDFFQKHKLTIEITLSTFVTYLLIFSTGVLFSPLFFLIYFLLFGLALLFEPAIAISLAIISTVFFLLTPRKDLLAEILQLASLFMITPLAAIFGKQYIKLIQNEQKIKILEEEGKALEEEVKTQEEEVKRWTLQEFKEHLANIWQSLDNLAADETLSEKNKQVLQEISDELSTLLESERKMEEKVKE